MKFTAQEEYGLRCILQLARLEEAAERETGAETSGEEPPYLRISDISETEGLSEQYVGKLFRILAKAGLVSSVRGRRGGYRLARPVHQIHVSDILAALGGKIYEPEVCDRYRGNRRLCVHTNDCAVRSLWAGLQLMIEQVLSDTTLKDLVCSERSMARWMRARSDTLENPGIPESAPVSFVELAGFPERRPQEETETE